MLQSPHTFYQTVDIFVLQLDVFLSQFQVLMILNHIESNNCHTMNQLMHAHGKNLRKFISMVTTYAQLFSY